MNFLNLRYAKFRRKTHDETSDDEMTDKVAVEMTDMATEEVSQSISGETSSQMSTIDKPVEKPTGEMSDHVTDQTHEMSSTTTTPGETIEFSSKTSYETSPMTAQTHDTLEASKIDENSIRKTSKFERFFDVTKLPGTYSIELFASLIMP